jgi:hypothetical protein
VAQEQISVVAHRYLSQLFGIAANFASGEQGRVVIDVDRRDVCVDLAFVQDGDGDDHLHVRPEIALAVLREYQVRRGLSAQRRDVDEFQLFRDQRGRFVGVSGKGDGDIVHVPVGGSHPRISRSPTGYGLGPVFLRREGALEAWLNRSCGHPPFLSLNGAAVCSRMMWNCRASTSGGPVARRSRLTVGPCVRCCRDLAMAWTLRGSGRRVFTRSG